MTNWPYPEEERLNSITDGIRQAFGPGSFNCLRTRKGTGDVYSGWSQMYPIAWMPSVLTNDYELTSARVELIALNTDWVDIADILLVAIEDCT